jgi:hypothetical protein
VRFVPEIGLTSKWSRRAVDPDARGSFETLDSRMDERGCTQRSVGVRPVRFAIRASMCGPISSLSWNANTKSGHEGRSSVR